MEIGTIQKLKVSRTVDFGVYLTESDAGQSRDRGAGEVLLPRRQVPEGAKAGDLVEVFVYRDSSDRPIATTHRPKILLHQTALLAVREVTRIGAFLDWGLEKDLLLPFREQRGKVRAGDEVLVALYLDKSGRLAATMNVYPWLKQRAPYVTGDEVRGRVYETSRNFGVFVAVDDCYSALIPRHDAQGQFAPGEIIDLRVVTVREDGRLVVTAKKKAWLQMDVDAEHIFQAIEEGGGSLPFDDRADPERIDAAFGISKAAFKRAVGRLLKEKRIEKRDGRLVLAATEKED